MTETIHRIRALESGKSLSFDVGYTCGLKWNSRRLQNSYLAEDSERDRELAISRNEANLFTARFYSDSSLANLPGTHLRVPGTRDVPIRSRASLVKACTFRLLRS